MISFGVGEAAALATCCIWAVSCQIHTQLSRVLGATSLTLLRLPLAVTLLFLGCIASGVSFALSERALWFLLLSGGVGIALCDWLFYASAVRVGPRTALVCQSLWACMAALFGYLLRGEVLGVFGTAGMLVATLGTLIVVTDGKAEATGTAQTPAQRLQGAGMALLSALFLALGMLASKEALMTGADPLLCGLVRTVAAMVLFWPVAMMFGRLRPAVAAVRREKGSLRMMVLGGILGPGLGVWFSLVAVANTNTGVAATLIGLEPIAIIPVTWIADGRAPSLRSVAGAVVAFAGTALLLAR